MTIVRIKETICYAHRLVGHPKCGILHGHEARVEIELEGNIDRETGMVVDFGDLKALIKRYDHQTILAHDDPLVLLIEQVHPVVDIIGPPTAEVLANKLASQIKALYKPDCIRVRFFETEDNCAEVILT